MPKERKKKEFVKGRIPERSMRSSTERGGCQRMWSLGQSEGEVLFFVNFVDAWYAVQMSRKVCGTGFSVQKGGVWNISSSFMNSN